MAWSAFKKDNEFKVFLIARSKNGSCTEEDFYYAYKSLLYSDNSWHLLLDEIHVLLIEECCRF